jgi:hypothetical protein
MLSSVLYILMAVVCSMYFLCLKDHMVIVVIMVVVSRRHNHLVFALLPCLPRSGVVALGDDIKRMATRSNPLYLKPRRVLTIQLIPN